MEYIHEFDNILNKELCEHIIHYFNKEDDPIVNGTTGSGYRPEIKKATDLLISNNILSDENNRFQHPEIWRNIEAKLFETVQSYLQQYVCMLRDKKGYKFFENAMLCDEGFLIHKYNKNEGYFKRHTDNKVDYNGKRERQIVYIIYLNTVDEGGETLFHDYTVKPKQGKIIFFPSTWTYVHEGNMPLSDDKYIITGWLYMSDGMDINTLIAEKQSTHKDTIQNPGNDKLREVAYSETYYKWNDCKTKNVEKMINTFNKHGCIIISRIVPIAECKEIYKVCMTEKNHLINTIQNIKNCNLTYEIKDLQTNIPLKNAIKFIEKIYSHISIFCQTKILNPFITGCSSYFSYSENNTIEQFYRHEGKESLFIVVILEDINMGDSKFQFIPLHEENNNSFANYSCEAGSIVIMSSKVLKRKSLHKDKRFSVFFTFTIGEKDSLINLHENDIPQEISL